MGICYLYGENAPVSANGIAIVASAEEPALLQENMVWVQTNKAGKDYVFAETEPENPTEGLIWFALKKFFGIITQTQIYLDEKWTLVNAYMYLSGEWVLISNSYTYLYKYGDECSTISGG